MDKKQANELFVEMLDLMEFRLIKDEEGYGLIDLQGGNLGDIQSERFESGMAVLDRLDRYIDDYYVNAIEEGIETLDDKENIFASGDTYDNIRKLLKMRDDLDGISEEYFDFIKDYKRDLEIMDLVLNHPESVVLEELPKDIFKELKTDDKINSEGLLEPIYGKDFINKINSERDGIMENNQEKKRLTQEEVNEIIEKHKEWLKDIPSENAVRADFSNMDLSGLDLSNADLKIALLNGADLSNADLHGANLNSAELHGADLSGANLHEANLQGVKLQEANLTKTDLSGADLYLADFGEANLTDVNLENVKNYTESESTEITEGFYRSEDPYYNSDEKGVSVEFLMSMDDSSYEKFVSRTPLLEENGYSEYSELLTSDDYLNVYVSVYEDGSVTASVGLSGGNEYYSVPLSKNEQELLMVMIADDCQLTNDKSLDEMLKEAKEEFKEEKSFSKSESVKNKADENKDKPEKKKTKAEVER